MGRLLHLRVVSATAIACAACGSSAETRDAQPAEDAGGSEDAAAVVGSDGSSSCDGCSRGAGDGGGVSAVDSGSDAAAGSAPTVSVLTYHNDVARTGQYQTETVLTPSDVNASTFGKKFAQPVDGYVYAQPLFVPALTIGGATHDVVFVVTEGNSIYAFDANASGPVLWHTNVGTSLSCSDLDDCGDLVPGAGITGTPVIDPSTQTMYLVALTKDSMGDHHRLHAIDLITGADKLGGPVDVSPTAQGTGANSMNGTVQFDPGTHYQRCALALIGDIVYIGIGSNAESDSDNHGWVVGYGAGDLSSTMTFCTSPDDNWSSIWQSGGGLSADSAGYIYAETANGTFDVNTGGKDYGDTALKLDSTGGVVDYFTPYNQADLSNGDIDFGAANPVVLPDQTGPVAHELLASGKPGILYLINRDDMGHYHSGSDTQIVQSVPAFPNTTGVTNGIFMSPAYWNGWIYVSGIGDSVQAFALSAGRLSTSPASQTTEQFSWPGATASVSSNGSTAGILWVLDGKAGVLHAYDATNLASELYNTTQATGGRDTPGHPVKFAVPTVAKGHVYVGTQTELDVYGPLP
ncbi:MAG: pyrrolo-quinoline quinone [Polyangiaceae bacterium]|jgi:hypothetical protein